jgi:hypothetical protein
MIIVVVGSEQKYWTNEQEIQAKKHIHRLISDLKVGMLTVNGKTILLSSSVTGMSGVCPKGGVDIWFQEECIRQNLPFIPRPPDVDSWNDKLDKKGYKSRNLQMVKEGNVFIDIEPIWKASFGDNHKAVDNFRTYRWSGGTWTLTEAKKVGKQVYTIVIE